MVIYMELVLLLFQALITNVNAVHDQTLCGNAARDASVPNSEFKITETAHSGQAKECLWIITANLGMKVKLTFTAITFTQTPGCTGSKLEIFDGADATGTKLGEICDLTGTTEFVSEGYQMFLKFTAVNLQNQQGFTAPYTQINGIDANQHDKTICGDEVINTANGLDFWSIPLSNAKAHNKQCRWRLYADEGKKVQVTLNEVSFPNTATCNTNRLQLFNGNNDTGTPIATICTKPVNNTFVSTGTEMFAKFTAFDVNAGQGFKAAYKQVNNARRMTFTKIWLCALLIAADCYGLYVI